MIERDKVPHIVQALTDLANQAPPPPPPLSNSELFMDVLPLIETARERGKTYEEIAAALQPHMPDLTVEKLQHNVYAARSDLSKGKKPLGLAAEAAKHVTSAMTPAKKPRTEGQQRAIAAATAARKAGNGKSAQPVG